MNTLKILCVMLANRRKYNSILFVSHTHNCLWIIQGILWQKIILLTNYFQHRILDPYPPALESLSAFLKQLKTVFLLLRKT